jgi:hypothetical protein
VVAVSFSRFLRIPVFLPPAAPIIRSNFGTFPSLLKSLTNHGTSFRSQPAIPTPVADFGSERGRGFSFDDSELLALVPELPFGNEAPRNSVSKHYGAATRNRVSKDIVHKRSSLTRRLSSIIGPRTNALPKHPNELPPQ